MSNNPQQPSGSSERPRPTIPIAAEDVTILDVKPMAQPKERASPWSSLYGTDLFRHPCFRQAGLWGIGVGSAMAVHSALRHRSQFKAINAFMITMLGVGSGAWLLCRSQQREEAEVMRVATKKLAEQQHAQKEAVAAPGASAGGKRS